MTTKTPSTTSAHRLVSNTAWNVATLFSNAVIGFLLIRFFLNHLGPARYGVWILIGSLFRYRGLLSMGLNSAINRYVPMYLAQGNREAAQRAMCTVFGFYLLTGIVFLGLTALLRHYVGVWFTIGPELLSSARQLVLIVGVGFAVVMPLQLASAALTGCQRYDIVNAVTLVMLVGRTGLLLILLQRGHGIVAMGWVFAASEIAVRCVHWFYARRLLRDFRLLHWRIDGALLKEMLAYGTNSFLYVVGGIALIKVGDLLVGISSLGMEGVTQFSVAAAAVFLLMQFVQAFTQAILPAVSDLDARSETVRLREMSFLAQKYSLLLILPAVCFLVVMGKSFLTVWVGDEIGDAHTLSVMTQVLAILAIGHGLRLTQHSNFLVLVGRGEHRLFGRLTAVTLVVALLFSVLALWGFRAGLLGVAWANFIPLAIVSGIVLPRHFFAKMEMTFSENLHRVWQPALRGAAPAMTLIVVWAWFMPPINWLQLLSVILAAGLATGIGAWGLGLNGVERFRLKTAVLARRGQC